MSIHTNTYFFCK